MTLFSHAMKHFGLFSKGSALAVTSVACGVGTAALIGASSFFYLTTLLTYGLTYPLLSLAILSTSAMGMASSDAAAHAGDSFHSAFNHC